MVFQETADVLANLQASVAYGQGDHMSSSIRSSGPGMSMGEVPYDPAVHDQSDIKPDSLMEMITGDFHVEMRRPDRPLQLHVVTDYSGMGYMDEIALAKRQAASVVTEGLVDSLTGVTDRLDTYTIGARSGEQTDIYTEELAGERATPGQRAKAIADMNVDGITVVISDFSQLPLEQLGKQYAATVGVKVNHLLERNVPAGVGTIALSGGHEVNTDKPRNLRKTNDRLSVEHREVIARLNRVGIAVASIITSSAFAESISPTTADRELAAAFEALTVN